MKKETLEVNPIARRIALITRTVNISMYVLGTIIIFFDLKSRYGTFDVFDCIAFVAFYSFAISFIIACSFSISNPSRKMQTVGLYVILLIFNFLSFLFYYAISSLSEGGNWLG